MTPKEAYAEARAEGKTIREASAAYNRQRAAYRAECGLCIKCGREKVAADKASCEACLTKHNTRQSQTRKRRPGAGTGAWTPPLSCFDGSCARCPRCRNADGRR
jgi:hypothetical protein